MKKKVFVSAITIVLIIVGIVLNNINNNENIIIDEKPDNYEEPSQIIFVQIGGAIRRPGVYEMCSDDRVNDLIIKAGGVLSNADLKNVNLVQRLNDGAKIIISSKGDDEKANQDGKISINNASLDELTSLSGIGVARAQSIIDYRSNNGGFRSINELLEISGISESILSQIINDICL